MAGVTNLEEAAPLGIAHGRNAEVVDNEHQRDRVDRVTAVSHASTQCCLRFGVSIPAICSWSRRSWMSRAGAR